MLDTTSTLKAVEDGWLSRSEVGELREIGPMGDGHLSGIFDQNITKTCLYNFDPLKPDFYIV